jgi:hypothetical protein
MKPKDIKRQDDDDLATVLMSPQGRRFIRRLLSLSMVGQSGIGATTHDTYFNLGIKHVGQALEKEIKTNHTRMYALMVNEEFSEDPNTQTTTD